MIIRVLLLSLLALIGYRFFLRRSKLPVHIVVVLGLLACCSVLVLFPDLTTVVANAVGVGRGVDLVTYLVEITVLFVMVHYYTKFVEQQQQITRLVREVALLRAEVEGCKGPSGLVAPPGGP